SLRASGIPVAALAQLYRRAKRDVPRDLAGDGMLNAYVSRVSYPDAEHPRWIGQGTVTNVHLSSPTLTADFQVDSAHFGFNQVERSPEGPGSAGLTLRLAPVKATRTFAASNSNVFTVDAFKADLGGVSPLTIAGAN